MPGLSFIGDVERGADALVAGALRALDDVGHDHTYRSTVLQQDPSHLLAVSAYPQYPVASYELGDVRVHLEGRIYRPFTTPALRDLARILFEPGAPAQATEWLRGVDGEFVIVATHRPTGRIAILNDLLGRLPLYCRRAASAIAVSRELRFVAVALPPLGFDRMGLAQYLLVGFPLGRRTLLEGVERVAAGTCIRIDARSGTVSATSAPPLDLGSDGGPEVNARSLAAVFTDSCRARAANGDNVVSLSGGADARSVAACLHRLGIPFRCATFLSGGAVAAADAAIAERLAALFDSPWHRFDLPTPSAAHRRCLLRHKAGLNPLSMAYLITYLEQVVALFGAGITLFTGDGGDKLLPDLRPPAPAHDLDGAVAAVLRARQMLSIDQVSALTGVSRPDLYGELRDRLAAYPEADWGDRHAHFEIFERAFKLVCEGEDRYRGYVWSTAPFYATPFFLAAMRAGGAKAHRRLTRDFLLALSPAAAAVDYAGVGAPIDSDAFRVAAKAAALLGAQGDARPRTVSPPAPEAAATADSIAAIRRRMTRCDAVAAHLDADRLADFLDGPAASLPHAVDALATLSSLIEEFADGGAGVEANPQWH